MASPLTTPAFIGIKNNPLLVTREEIEADGNRSRFSLVTKKTLLGNFHS